jgi:hypothetical protein
MVNHILGDWQANVMEEGEENRKKRRQERATPWVRTLRGKDQELEQEQP